MAVVLAFCWLPLAGYAQLGERAFVSLLTCGAGDEVESFFGHSALRVCDPDRGVDCVYNYGTYDFDQPHFYWRFTRGSLDYCLSRTTFSHFIASYYAEHRAVYEQRLYLDSQQCNNLFALLENNHRPEYRNYRYDFFRDNCATRPRDIIEAVLGHATAHYDEPAVATTYRDVLADATAAHLWWQLGFDMVLGTRADHRCDARELMFAPLLLMRQVEQLTLEPDGVALAAPTVTLLPDRRTAATHGATPLVCFWSLCVAVIALTVLAMKKGWSLRWLDIPLYGAGFLVSLVLLFLWLGTTHYYTAWNFNLLWASPLLIYYLIYGRRSRRWVVVVGLVSLFAALTVTLVGWPQQLNAAVAPLVVILIVRMLALLIPQQNN